MSKNIGFLFSGQGSQYIGMGKDLYDNYDYVRDMFAEANNILGYKLEDIIFEENELLNQTLYTQTSVLVVTCCLYEVVKRELGINASVLAGFSLGEYSALYANGIFSFSEIVQLVKYRANFMDQASSTTLGAMAAVIGLEKEKLEELVNSFENVWIANYNTPSQLVISGVKENVLKIADIITKDFGKRAIVLNVSGGFHSPLMLSAANNFRNILEEFNPKKPNMPMIMNYNADLLDYENLKEAMKKQIYSPVFFSDTITKMINEFKINQFIEIGPGRVLSGFVKKTDRSILVFNFEKLQDINNYKESK
ncbi:MAG: ACP S-malonyltransferase [Bacilli bacterium]